MSSRSLNKVLLIGNLTRDPELRYTPQGTPVCTFGLATNRSWQPSSGGERQEETEFHRIVSWNKLAELCSELLFKGRKVFVEGRLQTRNWTSSEGQERTTVEVVIDNMIVLDSKRKEGQGISGGTYPQQQGSYVADDSQATAPVEDDVAQDSEEEEKEDKKEAAKSKVAKSTKSADKKAKEKPQSKTDEPVTQAADDGKVNPDDIPF